MLVYHEKTKQLFSEQSAQNILKKYICDFSSLTKNPSHLKLTEIAIIFQKLNKLASPAIFLTLLKRLA